MAARAIGPRSARRHRSALGALGHSWWMVRVIVASSDALGTAWAVSVAPLAVPCDGSRPRHDEAAPEALQSCCSCVVRAGGQLRRAAAGGEGETGESRSDLRGELPG